MDYLLASVTRAIQAFLPPSASCVIRVPCVVRKPKRRTFAHSKTTATLALQGGEWALGGRFGEDSLAWPAEAEADPRRWLAENARVQSEFPLPPNLVKLFRLVLVDGDYPCADLTLRFEGMEL